MLVGEALLTRVPTRHPGEATFKTCCLQRWLGSECTRRARIFKPLFVTKARAGCAFATSSLLNNGSSSRGRQCFTCTKRRGRDNVSMLFVLRPWPPLPTFSFCSPTKNTCTRAHFQPRILFLNKVYDSPWLAQWDLPRLHKTDLSCHSAFCERCMQGKTHTAHAHFCTD